MTLHIYPNEPPYEPIIYPDKVGHDDTMEARLAILIVAVAILFVAVILPGVDTSMDGVADLLRQVMTYLCWAAGSILLGVSVLPWGGDKQ